MNFILYLQWLNAYLIEWYSVSKWWHIMEYLATYKVNIINFSNFVDWSLFVVWNHYLTPLIWPKQLVYAHNYLQFLYDSPKQYTFVQMWTSELASIMIVFRFVAGIVELNIFFIYYGSVKGRYGKKASRERRTNAAPALRLKHQCSMQRTKVRSATSRKSSHRSALLLIFPINFQIIYKYIYIDLYIYIWSKRIYIHFLFTSKKSFFLILAVLHCKKKYSADVYISYNWRKTSYFC